MFIFPLSFPLSLSLSLSSPKLDTLIFEKAHAILLPEDSIFCLLSARIKGVCHHRLAPILFLMYKKLNCKGLQGIVSRHASFISSFFSSLFGFCFLFSNLLALRARPVSFFFFFSLNFYFNFMYLTGEPHKLTNYV